MFSDSVSIQESGSHDAKIKVTSENFNSFYGLFLNKDVIVNAKISVNKDKNTIVVFFKVDQDTPEMWKYMAKISGKDDDLLANFKLNEVLSGNIITGDNS